MKQHLEKRIGNIPFKPSKFPFFYGWLILIAGTVGVVLSVPGQTVGVSVFTEHLLEALSIESWQLTLSYGLGTIASAFIIKYAGLFYDHYGARITGTIASLGLGITLMTLSQSSTINHFIIHLLPEIEAWQITIALMTVLFFLLRFFGQGVLTMASRNMVMKWFDKHRGLANSFLGVFVAFGFSYAPELFDTMINNTDWQTTWFRLGIFTSLIFVVFIFILFRDNPEQCELKPDGNLRLKINQRKRPLSTSKHQYTLKEAQKTYSYWVFLLALTMNSLYITAVTFLVTQIFDYGGMSRDEAVSIFLPSAIVAVIMHFTGSFLSDYMKLKYFLILHLAGMMLSMAGIMFISHDVVWMIIAGNGISSAMFGILSAITWPRFYGTKHLGEISGSAMGWMVAGSAVGPFLFSLSKKLTESYFAAAFLCFIITFIIFALGFKADNVNESESFDGS